MPGLPDERAVLDRILHWGGRDEAVRLLVLTSSRARSDETVDLLSDYDVVVASTDLAAFDPAAAYGPPLARWGDEHLVHGVTTLFRGVVYEDGVKIDWTLWPAEVPALVAGHGLTDDLDVGYRVLLDKDGAAAEWPEAAYRAHVPAQPTEAEYLALVEEFWWSSTYVAKALWRGEHLFADFVLAVDLRHGVLRRLLEWLVEVEHGWMLRPGAYGRGLEKLLPDDDARELAATYEGAAGAEAFERTVVLFRRAARAVADGLGFAYPQRVDDLASEHLRRVRALPPRP